MTACTRDPRRRQRGRKVVLRDYTECEAAWASQQATPPTTMAPSDGDTMAETTPEPCMQPTIVAEASFGELGIEGDLIESAAAISTDGVTWSPATIPGAQVWFAGGVFVAADHSQTGQASYFRSANGTDWSPIAIDSADSLDIIGTTNGTLVARMYRGESMTDSIALSSDGGSTWRELTTNDLAPGLGNTSYIATAAAGDLGIVVVLGTDTGNGDRPMEWTIATSGDGSTWSTDDAEAGDIGNGYPSWAFVDADRIGVVFGGAKRGADDSVLAVTLLGTPQR
ncbi:MAG: sialidase family protein [Acidimicrobiales bacterium]